MALQKINKEIKKSGVTNMETKELIANLKDRRMMPAKMETLSDKAYSTDFGIRDNVEDVFFKKDVKEFIRKFKVAIRTLEKIEIDWAVDIQRLIDELAGEKL